MENLTLTVVLGAALGAGLKTVFGQAHQEVSTLGKAMKEASKGLRDIGHLGQMQAGLEKARAKLRETQQTVMALRKELAADPGNATLAKKLAAASAKADKLSASLATQKDRVRAAGDSMRKAGIDTEHLTEEAHRLEGQVKKVGDAFARQNKILSSRSHGKQLMQDGLKTLLPVVGGLKLTTGAAIEFESAMSDVRKVVNFDTPEQFHAMGNDIQALSRRLPTTAAGLAQIMAAAGQSGVARNELTRFAEDAAKMGVAFDLSADEAGTKMAQWRTAFRMTQDDVRALADQINYLGNNGPATAATISDIVTRIGPLGEIGGVSSGKIAALGATISGMGIQSEIAATGIKNVILTLSGGASATNAQKAAFKSLGMDATDMAERMQKDGAGAILDVLDAVKKLPKAAQAATLQDLFGKESLSAVAPLLTNLELLRTNLHRVGDATKYSGSMEQEYLARADTTGNVLQIMRNAFSSLGKTVGDVFLPPLKVVARWLIVVTDKVTRFAEAHPKVTAALAGGIVAWGSYKSAVGAAQFAMSFLPGKLGLMSGGIGKLVGGLAKAPSVLSLLGTGFSGIGGALGLLFSPVGLIVGALVIGGLLIWKYWDRVQAFFIGFGHGLRDTVGPALDSLGEALGPLKPIWDAIVGAMGKAWDLFKGLFTQSTATSAQLQSATDAGQTFGAIVGAALSAVVTIVEWGVKAFIWLGEAIGTGIGMVVVYGGKALDWLGSAWTAAGDAIKAPFVTAFEWVGAKIDWIVGKWKALKHVIGMDAEKVAAPTAIVWNDGSNPNAQRPPPRARAALAHAAAGAGGGQKVTNVGGIVVHAAPGQNPQDIAKAVDDRLAQRERAAAAKTRSRLGDTE